MCLGVFPVTLIGLAGLVLVLGCADTQDTPNVPLEFVETYSFDGPVLEDRDLSGMACISPTRCLVGTDENCSVQVVALSRSGKALSVLQSVELLDAGDEIDIEAIAAEGDCYYIIGSHGIAKKSGQVQGNRYKLFRLPVDRATGMPAADGSGLSVASLAGILRRDSVLGPHFGRPLQQKGVNIEGLAIRKGRLYVGLRNPNLGGYAYVLEVGADDVFAGVGPPPYVLHKLLLGAGLGIREIAATREGFLIIAGNAGSEPSDAYPEAVDYAADRGFWMFAWDGLSEEVDKLGAIPNAPAKAEAMTILDETPDQVTVLILFDGARKGRPSVYHVR